QPGSRRNLSPVILVQARMHPESDSALVERCRRGDMRAFQRLFETHARSCHAVCARLLGDPALAEDALQEAFLKAHRRLDQFDGRASFGTWMHRIAVNTAIEFLRRRHPEDMNADMPAELEDEQADPQGQASQAELAVGIGAALSQLTALERSVFVLRHLEQRSLAEIALTLSSNVNACKQAIFRAVRKMRDHLAHFETSTS
ncbi:MAG: RNA polymerase sigma factor, partial [Xanthomonadales bacterium]|nr:RNA polymerase sigma factor [Xanthomonadales bacterium]